MAAIKHIIFKGKPRTGKSLFAKMIFDQEKTLIINRRVIVGDFNPFLFASNKKPWNYENVLIDDPVCKKFEIDFFYKYVFHDEIEVKIPYEHSFFVKTPRFIFTLDDTVQLPDTPSFNSHFKIIDFDKNPIADLTKLINEENIIINNHR